MRTVADYIQEHREHVIRRFVAEVRSLDVAQGLPENEVLDTLPEYLDALVALSRGEPRDPDAVKQRLEATHIGLRLRIGYRQEQVVWEYTQLSRILAALWDGKPEAELPPAEDVEALFESLQAAMDHVGTVYGDISMEDHQLERRTLRRLERETADLFTEKHPQPLSAKLPVFLEIIVDALRADGAALWLADAAQRLVPAAGAGSLPDPGADPVPVDGPGFLPRVAASEEGVALADASRPADPTDDALRHSGLRTMFGARLYPMGKLVGVLVVGKTTLEPFEPRERRLLGVLIERLTAIIDRTRLFEQTRRSRDLLQNLLDASVEGFYGIDSNGRCIYLNASAARLLGISDPDALLGQDMHALAHHSRADGCPFPASECPIRNVLHSGSPVHSLETVLWRADGSCFAAAMHAAPVLDDGGVDGVVVGFSDVSARKRQEELVQRLGSWADSLDESLASLAEAGPEPDAKLHSAVLLNRAVLENALDAVVGMDAGGAVIDWNAQAEQMFGWTRKEALGRSVAELVIPPHQRAAHDAGLLRYLATGTGPILNRRVELTALRRSGEEFPVELTVSPLSSSRTHVFYAFMRDLTARRQLEAERAAAMQHLERTLNLNESFMGVLAHDLRSPLSAVSIAATLMRKQPADLDVKRLGEMVGSSAARMARMVEQLLDVSRARLGGGIAMERQHVDLENVCREGIQETRVAHPQRIIEFEARGDCTGEWDPDRMAQVLSNLLGNAVQHGDAGAAVRVEIDGEDDGAVVLCVSNRGVIPPRLASTLFEPFSGGRHPPGSSRGLGLGLYITHEIVRGHGGSIDVQSSETTGLTRFLVRLPRHDGR